MSPYLDTYTEPHLGLERTFAALADPTRIDIVARLGTGSATVSELARPYSMSLTGFLKHVRVLEDAGLVRTAKAGRVRRCELDRGRVEAARAWFEDLRRVWDRRLDRMDDLLDDKEDR